jgi:hypothetical protein
MDTQVAILPKFKRDTSLGSELTFLGFVLVLVLVLALASVLVLVVFERGGDCSSLLVF